MDCPKAVLRYSGRLATTIELIAQARTALDYPQPGQTEEQVLGRLADLMLQLAEMWDRGALNYVAPAIKEIYNRVYHPEG